MHNIQFSGCGPHLGPLVRQIVEGTLPDDVLDEHGDSLFFICTAAGDGLRLTRHVRENFEVIILSDHIAPSRQQSNEADPVFRYFMYAVLHEVAHAVKDHKSLHFDGLSPEENAAQEEEADALAMQWFNERAQDVGTPQMTEEELEGHEQRNRDWMHAAWWA